MSVQVANFMNLNFYHMLKIGDKMPDFEVVDQDGNQVRSKDLVGKKIILVANLAPAKLCGVESNGMILASGEEDVRVVFLHPETKLGERVR